MSILLLTAVACKKSNDNKVTKPTTTTDSTITASTLQGNWVITYQKGPYLSTDSVGFWEIPDSTVIVFFDSSYLVVSGTTPTLHSFTLRGDTMNDVRAIYGYDNAYYGLNFLNIYINAADDSMVLYNHLSFDSIILRKVQ